MHVQIQYEKLVNIGFVNAVLCVIQYTIAICGIT